MKVCFTCKISKDEKEFSKRSSHSDGLQSACKACNKVRAAAVYAAQTPGQLKKRRAIQKTWVVKNLLRVQANQKRWVLENSEKVSARIYKWNSSNPERIHSKRLERMYGITLKEFNRMLLEQNQVCAICGEKDDKKLCVDHDHKTGKIRSLLCRRCNVALGNLRDSSRLATAAAKYLASHGNL